MGSDEESGDRVIWFFSAIPKRQRGIATVATMEGIESKRSATIEAFCPKVDRDVRDPSPSLGSGFGISEKRQQARSSDHPINRFWWTRVLFQRVRSKNKNPEKTG